MNYLTAIPSYLDGETALLVVDILHLLAEEILSRNDGAIRIYYYELDEMRRCAQYEQQQLKLPFCDPFHDLPF